ncbi:DUF4382 domain-containing protein [Winogradskyella sp. A3E31]|uniref:DUF4382 domain-containing protein n=1 Tax=Winogradskyella sp. A3E31 TaxID=3349637 RepID=UPI00398A54A4
MKLLKKLKFVLASLAVVLAMSCSDSNDGNTEPASISVKLVDAPGDYDNVFVEVVDVLVRYGDADDENADEDMDQDGDIDEDDAGWISVGVIAPGTYDLLELTGGVTLQLVENEEVEAGFIEQIRLVLGDENYVVSEGVESPLNTPSAQQSGLKVKVDQMLEGGFNYDFILDFDVDASIVDAGNSGNLNLKPVLRASLELSSGTLAGNVTNTDVAVEVSVDDGNGYTASTMVDAEGNFQIPGLPAGIYTVTVTPDPDATPLYEELVIEGVEIEVGSVNTLEPITLVEPE